MKKRIFLIDFDRTLTDKDTTDTLMEQYNEPMLREYQSRIRRGEINIKQYLAGLLESLTINKNDFQKKIADNVKFDFKFQDFIKTGIDYRIVSAGTYENIYAVLNKNNIKIDRELIYSNEAYFIENDKIKVEFPYDVDDCFEGICKKSIVQKYKELYEEVVFIGDGSSDISICGYADVIFAKKDHTLHKYCTDNKIDCILYEDFSDIIRYYNSL